ncbi:MbnP family protein [Adhaeribacter soli]|uniref:Copper-binding protein MbnP-like domain-containing protein n=1 Tax=Adhaeribacter soli TaxID=2607655 RepID=A0A5N1ITU7_9BACT|nr:MbnP family protein [Adhaeribacter soli]KAA9333595.1 hypothetical protein F0P94_10090 [Adhaeribacter soli]
MKNKLRLSYLILLSGLGLLSCKKDKVKPAEAKQGSMEVHFDSRRSLTEDFVVNKNYLNANNDSVSFSTFKYFISNVELVRPDGTTFAEPNSYHLIAAANTPASETFTIANIPDGNYSKIRFRVGVDQARNSSTATPVGDLDKDHDMTWDWNTGYTFVFAIGKFKSAPASATFLDFTYQIGKDAQYRTVELAFPSETPTAQIDEMHKPKMHLHANIFDIFGGPNVIDVKANSNSNLPQFSTVAPKIADNYAQMFRIDHIHAH